MAGSILEFVLEPKTTTRILFSQDMDLKQYVMQFAENDLPKELVPTTITLPASTTLPLGGIFP